MDSIVQRLADVYSRVTWVVAEGAYWISVALLVVSAVAALLMVIDLILTPTGRFKSADRAAQPRDGIILIGQLMAAALLIGAVVLAFRDTGNPYVGTIAGAADMDRDAASPLLDAFSFPEKDVQLSDAWLGGTVQQVMKDQMDFFVAQGEIESALASYDGFVDTSFLERVRGRGDGGSAAAVDTGGLEELNVAYFLEWPTANQVAQVEQTYDEALGLTVNWIPLASGNEMAEAMEAGDVDISYSQGLTPFANYVTAGSDLLLVGVAVSYADADNCVAGRGLGITAENAAQTLPGQSIYTPLGNVTHFKLLKMLEHLGVDPSTVELVPSEGGTAAVVALESGDVAMACAFGGAVNKMIANGGNLLMTGAEQEAIGIRVFDIISTTGDFAEAHPSVVTGFLQVTEDANVAYADGAGFPWRPIVALVAGAALMALLVAYRRASEERQAGMARYVWLALAVSSVLAVFLAFLQREDSSIPYMGLLLGVFIMARAWFMLARPEVRFDKSKVALKTDSRTESALIVDKLGMVYELPDGGSVEALKDVSFTLEPGRLLSLLGPSGCGKTTLLNIIAGFLAPTSGEVKLGSEPITGPGQDRGMVFQRGALFEWLTVNDNVGFGARMNGRSRPASREEVQDLLRIVGLQDFGEKAVYELSGGMQQRVALARCLANDPKLILMDEPLGALDALTREKMQRLVLELWNETGKTIVLVTHSVEEALYLGDQLFVMAPRPGRIEKVYDLPFAKQALTADARELKTSPEFVRVREEILGMIWAMEEQIMGTGGEN